MLRSSIVSTAVASLASLAIAPPTAAQVGEDSGRRASFTAGASFGDGETALALSAGLGFRLSSRIGVEFELAYARRLDFALELCPSPLVCVIGGQLPVTGRTVSLVPQLTIELLPVSRRVRAYAQAGVGGGHVRQRYTLEGPFASTQAVELTRSSAVVAVSFGGGVSVRLSPHLALGADVRFTCSTTSRRLTGSSRHQACSARRASVRASAGCFERPALVRRRASAFAPLRRTPQPWRRWLARPAGRRPCDTGLLIQLMRATSGRISACGECPLPRE